MRNKEVEKRLNLVISNSVPDVLDNILEKCEKKRGFNLNMAKSKTKEENNNWFPKYALAGGLAVLVFGISLGINQYNSLYKANSIIEFDVNPSIELKVNKKEDVIKAVALNDDAEIILKNMDLSNVDLDVAVNAIVGSMLKHGYISVDENSILVSVKNDEQKERERLQKEISKEISDLLKASSINGSIITQEFEDDKTLSKLSNNHNISVGKAKLINSVLESKITNAEGNLYTFESLATLSINELNVLLNSKETKVEKITYTGTASESGYIGKEKAKSIALTNAGTKESKVKKLEIEFDADSGRLTYEVDFQVAEKEYEYDIDAKTGEIIHKETDVDDDYKESIINSTSDKTSNSNSSSSTNKTSTNYITKSKAKSIAFNNAGVSSSSVRNLEVEFDKDDGVASYEIEFKVGNKEYSYDINAKTGKIIDKEVEIDD